MFRRDRPDIVFFDRLITAISHIIASDRSKILNNQNLEDKIIKFLDSIYKYGNAHLSEYSIKRAISDPDKSLPLPSERFPLPPPESLWEDSLKKAMTEMADKLSQIPIFQELQTLFLEQDPNLIFSQPTTTPTDYVSLETTQHPRANEQSHPDIKTSTVIVPEEQKEKQKTENIAPQFVANNLLQPFVNDIVLHHLEAGNFDILNNLLSLKKFWNYFQVVEDEKLNPPDNFGIRILKDGADLIIDYYSEKYHTNIQNISDISQLKSIVEKSDEKGIRMGFHYRPLDDVHSTPILYLEHEGEKLFLIADSMMHGQFQMAKQLQEETGIPVYTVAGSRQSDKYSCRADALVFLRIATALDDDKKYVLPDLFQYIKDNGKKQSQGYFLAELPEDFLILSQIKSFVEIHKKDPKKIIHRPNKEDITFSDYQKKYEDDIDTVKSGKKKGNTYLHKKSYKFANIIEIQFYIKQMKELLGEHWTKDMRDRFIQGAKEKFREQPPISLKIGRRSRKGLEEYAEDFIAGELRRLNIKIETVAYAQTQSVSMDHTDTQPIQKKSNGQITQQNNNNASQEIHIDRDLFLKQLNELAAFKNAGLANTARSIFQTRVDWTPLKLIFVQLSQELTKNASPQEADQRSLLIGELQSLLNDLIREKKINPSLSSLSDPKNIAGQKLIKDFLVEFIMKNSANRIELTK